MHNHCRRNVAVEHATARATVYTPRELLLADGHASRTGLGGGLRVDCNELTTSILSFVCEHRGQLAPRSVRDVPRHVRLGQKFFNVQPLDRDPAETTDEIARDFVQVIAALIGDAFMQAGKGRGALCASIRPAFAAGKGALASSDLSLGTLSPIGARNRLASRERCEMSDSEIDPDTLAVIRAAGDWLDLDMEDDVPLAALRQDRRVRIAWQIAVPTYFDLAVNADKTEPAGFADGQAIADAKLGRVIARAGAEAREAITPAEKRFIGLVEAAQALLFGRERPARQLGRRLAHCLQLGRLHIVCHRNAAAPIRLDPLLQPGVVETAEVSEHLGKSGSLRPIRLNPVFVRQQHLLAGERGISAPQERFETDSRRRREQHICKRLRESTIPR